MYYDPAIIELEKPETADEPITAIAEYSPTVAGLATLRKKYAGVVFDVRSPKGMTQAREACAEIRGIRTSLEKLRVEIKSPALDRCRLIDAEAKRITAELVALEQPIATVVREEEARRERVRQEKIKAEVDRIAAIQAEIQRVACLPIGLINRSPENIQETIDGLVMGYEFDAQEFAENHAKACNDTVATLYDLLHSKQAAEAERIALEEARKQQEAEAAAAREEARKLAEAEAARVSEERRIMAEEKARTDAEAAEQAAILESERQTMRALLVEKEAEAQRIISAERARQAEERTQLEADRMQAQRVFDQLEADRKALEDYERQELEHAQANYNAAKAIIAEMYSYKDDEEITQKELYEVSLEEVESINELIDLLNSNEITIKYAVYRAYSLGFTAGVDSHD